MSGTHLFYNGVLLQDCETREFIQQIERDESGTDPVFSRFRITAVSTVASIDSPDFASATETKHAQHNSAVRVPFGDDPEAAESAFEAVDQLRIIQARLQEPKKDFWLAVNGTSQSTPLLGVPDAPTESDNPFSGYRIVLAATGEYAHVPDDTSSEFPEFIKGFRGSSSPSFTTAKRVEHIDCNNGPKPTAVDVRIIGGRYLRVQITIEVCVCICRGLESGTVPPVRDARKVVGVISNKWTVVEDLDANFCTTHNIEGALIISDHRYKAQAMRTMVHPGLFPYAKLERRQFAVDKTGLKLGYSFSIREVGVAPPPGLVDWEATYSESSAMGTANQFGTMNIRVRGAVKRPSGQTAREQKTIMLRLMYAILRSRITGVNPAWNALPGNDALRMIVKDCVVTENVKEPAMEMRVGVAISGGKLLDFNMRLENMGNDLPIEIANYDPKWWPLPDYFQYDFDAENAEFETELWGGSYLEQYQQTPCNLWKSTPRGARTTEIELTSDYVETPGDGEGGTEPPPEETAAAKPDHSFFSSPFVAYDVPDLYGDLSSVTLLPELPSSGPSNRFGLSNDEMISNAAYVIWDSDVRYATQSGVVQLPLSAPREEFGAPGQIETSVTVRLHAPMAQRVFRMKAMRNGDWPQVPKPVAVHRDANGYKETLLSQKHVMDTPKLDRDNSNMLYAMQIEWVYALSRPPGYLTYAGSLSTETDTLRAGSSPIDKTTAGDNRVSLLAVWSTSIDSGTV